LGGDTDPRCGLCAGAIASSYEGVARVDGVLVHAGCFVNARDKREVAGLPAPPEDPGRVRRFVEWLRQRRRP
jgi:hypothetical protein